MASADLSADGVVFVGVVVVLLTYWIILLVWLTPSGQLVERVIDVLVSDQILIGWTIASVSYVYKKSLHTLFSGGELMSFMKDDSLSYYSTMNHIILATI